MRRIATLAVSTAVAASCLGAMSSADAAAAKYFATANGWKTIKASGYVAKNSSQVKVTFTLADGARNGWTACVRFAFDEGNKRHWQKFWLRSGSGARLDAKAALKGSTTDSYTRVAWVQECGISKKNGKTYYGPPRKLI